jgi:transcriptional regulator GlxA family with amidase domain
MNTRYLYTIRWTQPYATEHLRPYLRSLQEQMEQLIESQLDSSDFAEANNIIRRIQNASKGN